MSFASEAAERFVEESRAQELDRLSARIRELRERERFARAARWYRMAAEAVGMRLEVEAEYDAAYRRVVGSGRAAAS